MLTSESERGTSTGAARAAVIRRFPVGAEVQPGGDAHFRVWAPRRRRVELVLEGDARALGLERDEGGHWSVLATQIPVGTRYRFRLDGEPTLYPDPASRFQPQGPHGPSELVDPAAFSWTDRGWMGLPRAGQVLYELHLGTFSPEGTWEGARSRLPHLRALGVTAIEIMPVAAFPGAFGWGYDGVDLYAPHHGYGRPDDFRRFVDDAHRTGIGVLLDVVYNHLGPDGNYLAQFSPGYFSDKATEWGQAIDFDGPDAGPVRDFFAYNAAYWIDEYHLDGLRLDATQSIHDQSDEHILAELGRRARAAASGRRILIFAENEPQDTRLVRPPRPGRGGGYGLDGLWNDDFHHSARVALTGRNEAYYQDYRGTPQELISAAKHGTLYQGQRYAWQKKRRGTSTRGIAPAAFVSYLENHDQVANSASGERLWRLTSPGRHRAMTGLLLLGPWTPLLFQGQEWSSPAPFLFFADHNPELAALVRQGRAEFLGQFPSCATPEVRARLPDPAARATFEGCRLDWSAHDAGPQRRSLDLHRDLLALRRSDVVIRAQGSGGVTVDGAVLAPECLALRFSAPDEAGDDRLLLVNLGSDLALAPAPEPLLAPPPGSAWALVWSSEDPRYGGSGTPPLDDDDTGWRIPGHAAVLLRGTL